MIVLTCVWVDSELEGEMAKFLKDLEAAINLKPGQNDALDRTN